MTGLPKRPDNERLEDVEFDLDDLDDAALQRLLEEDPELEKELLAIEAREQSGEVGDSAGTAFDEVNGLPDLPPLISAISPEAEELDAPFATTPDHDDLAEFSYGDTEIEGDDQAVEPDTDDLYEADTVEIDIRPVPRINIHVFFSTDTTADLIQKASADRRLAKAHVSLQGGGALRAAEMFSAESTPNLLIIEASASTKELLNGLDALAQVCDPSTRVIVLGHVNDIGLYRELMSRGISDYIVRPQSPLHVIAAIGALYSDPSEPPIGKTYVFVGARGGSGSSSICHNVAWSIAEQYKSDTVLMDLDLAFGTAGLDFEHDPSQGLAEALAAPERLDDVLLDRLLQKCTDRLNLFVAPNALERDYDLPAESFETVVDIVRHSAPSIVVDLPHIWSNWARQMLQAADEIIITATPDLSSFRNAKNIAEVVKTHRTNDAPPVLVLNQVGVPKRPEVPAEQFAEALELDVRATIPWDPVLFGNCATNAQPLLAIAPKSKVTQEVDKIAQILLGLDGRTKSMSGFSLKSLFGKNR